MSNIRKLSEVVGSCGMFSPDGFIDKYGRFVPMVRVANAKHAISIKTIRAIQDDPESFFGAAWDAIDMESKVREAHAEKQAREAQAAKEEVKESNKRDAPLADTIAASTRRGKLPA